MNRTNDLASRSATRESASTPRSSSARHSSPRTTSCSRTRTQIETVANAILEKQEIYGDDLVRLLDDQHFKRPEIDWTDETCWPKFMNWSKYDPRVRGELDHARGRGEARAAREPAPRDHGRSIERRCRRARADPDARGSRQEGGRLARFRAVGKAAGRYSLRFGLLYGGLAVVLLAAVVGFVVLVVQSDSSSSNSSASGKAWSPWKPAERHDRRRWRARSRSTWRTSTSSTRRARQLVAVVAGRPTVTADTHKIAISTITVNQGGGDDVVPTNSTWSEQLCGLGTACSIDSGQATEARGRLVRREALEVALYTFKFVPAINSIVAFMPPPPGKPPTTLLYLQKDDLAKQLSQPLADTLPLAKPPLPTLADPTEKATIDKLTLPTVYSFKVQQLQDASAVLILNPFKS